MRKRDKYSPEGEGEGGRHTIKAPFCDDDKILCSETFTHSKMYHYLPLFFEGPLPKHSTLGTEVDRKSRECKLYNGFDCSFLIIDC